LFRPPRPDDIARTERLTRGCGRGKRGVVIEWCGDRERDNERERGAR
jgi:hypothetical protein